MDGLCLSVTGLVWQPVLVEDAESEDLLGLAGSHCLLGAVLRVPGIVWLLLILEGHWIFVEGHWIFVKVAKAFSLFN